MSALIGWLGDKKLVWVQHARVGVLGLFGEIITVNRPLPYQRVDSGPDMIVERFDDLLGMELG
jgi:hypothetical protein